MDSLAREMKEITPREADKYIKTLQRTQPVEVGGRRRKTEYMTPANIEKVIKLLIFRAMLAMF